MCWLWMQRLSEHGRDRLAQIAALRFLCGFIEPRFG